MVFKRYERLKELAAFSQNKSLDYRPKSKVILKNTAKVIDQEINKPKKFS